MTGRREIPAGGTSELLLGIDIGTSSTKAVLARPDGTIVGVHAVEHGVSRPRPGWAEHDPEAVWWADILHVCDGLREHLCDVRAVCVSGLGPCLLAADRFGRPIRAAILYGIDTRATIEIEELTARFGSDAILRRGGSALSSQAVGPKLLWLRRNEPDVWQRTRRLLMASSYAIHRLTGEYVLDHHSASQCDPLYDLSANAWSMDWADELAPDLELPRLAWSNEIVGAVTAAAADATGLPIGTPVAAGTIDAWAEAHSVGVSRPGDLMLMYGTTIFLIASEGRAEHDETLWQTAGCLPGSTSTAAGLATSGALTSWLREIAGGVSFEQLLAEAAATPAGADGLLALPYFAGERTPIYDPDARGVIAGLTTQHGRGHIYRALLEATAYAVRHTLEAFGAEVPRRVVAVGGGAEADLWLQVMSDVTGMSQCVPVVTIGAAYGDALLAAQAIGLASLDADWAKTARIVQPHPNELYDELYVAYRSLHEATAELQHQLAGIGRRDGARTPLLAKLGRETR
jgi:xylulokinase